MEAGCYTAGNPDPDRAERQVPAIMTEAPRRMHMVENSVGRDLDRMVVMADTVASIDQAKLGGALRSRGCDRSVRHPELRGHDGRERRARMCHAIAGEVAVSLAVAAIKIAALRSLRGRRSAGQAVFDSAVEPFDALRDQGRRSLWSNCDSSKRHVQGRDLFGARQVIDLAFDMFVAQAVTVDAGEMEIRIPASDEGNEIYLRSIAYEVEKVLHPRALIKVLRFCRKSFNQLSLAPAAAGPVASRRGLWRQLPLDFPHFPFAWLSPSHLLE
jgi:hypothetical protein